MTHPKVMLDILEARLARPVVGVKYRAAGSSAVYFGPFENLDALQAWCAEHKMDLMPIALVDPESDENEWWYW
jgi:hypothetical protein